jgi:hypothetical protein
MAVRWAISSGAFSSTATWNDGATLGIPTTGDDVWSNGFTVNMDTNATVNSLNNNARARDIATPAMTANNAPSPYVSNSSTGPDSFRAFNKNYGDFWAGTGSASWISIDFGTGTSIVIDGYTIYGTGNSVENPRNWTFEGSNNNVSWTILHTVTLPSGISNNGTYSVASIGNPLGFRYYRINISLNGGSSQFTRITELELYQPGTAALAAGGSFNFNTAGVTVSATSTSASLGIQLGTTFSTITATTGTVTLNVGSNINYAPSLSATLISNYSGACNFVFSGVNIIALNPGTGGLVRPFDKTSSGTITINANITTTTNASGGVNILTSSAGNTIINGNVTSGAGICISQSAGNVTVTGNVTGGTSNNVHGISLTGAASQFTINGDVRGGSATNAHGISFGGTLGTVNGNVTGGGGSGASGIRTDTGGVNVTGNVIGNAGTALIIAANSSIIGNVFGGGIGTGVFTTTNNSFTVIVTGDVYASTTVNGIVLTGTGTQVVNLTGNMYNTLGRSAIWCPNVFISNTATTLWRMDTGGGNYKFLYSADSTPNLPATTNVRNGVTFGPALSLTGTMVVPSASDVRENVPVDNTVGTGELTSADIISGINASSDSLAVRLKNTLTDTTAGNIISQYNNS